MKSRIELPLSIEQVLIEDDALFDSLTEEQRNVFAKYCINDNPEEFSRCVHKLLDNYNSISFAPSLLEYEHEFITQSKFVHKHIQTFSEQFESILSELHKKALQSHALLQGFTEKNIESTSKNVTPLENSVKTTSIYNAPISSLESLQTNMLNQLTQMKDNGTKLIQQSESMLELTTNLGIVKIQKRLEFCMNMLFEAPLTIIGTTDAIRYCEITKSLGQFWFYEGETLSPEAEQIRQAERSVQMDPLFTEKTKEVQHKKNIWSLLFFFLSKSIDEIAEARLCFIQILQYISNYEPLTLGQMHHMSLKEFSENSPTEFIILYEYLFQQPGIFSEQISNLIQNKHIYATYNHALFHLYAARAYSQCSQSSMYYHYQEQSMIYETEAKNNLITVFENGLTEAEAYLTEYFTLDIDTQIKLAVICFKQSNHKQHQFSEAIYEKLQTYSKKRLDRLDKTVFELFSFWMRYDNEPLRIFAAKWIENYAKNNHVDARSILVNNIDIHADYGVMLAKIALYNADDVNLKITVLGLLEGHPERDNSGAILYHMFLLVEKISNTFDTTLLISSAKHKYRDAVHIIFSSYERGLAEGKMLLLEEIIRLLDDKSPFLFELLENLYLKKDPSISLDEFLYLKKDPSISLDEFNKNVRKRENLINLFYPYLSRSLGTDKNAALLDALDHYASKKHITAYEALLGCARHNLDAAIILAKNLHSETGVDNPIIKKCHDKLVELITHSYTMTQNACAYADAEALCLLFVNENPDLSSTYFKICCQSSNGLDQICNKLEKTRHMKEFLGKCTDTVRELIPKKFKLEQQPGYYSAQSNFLMFSGISAAAKSNEEKSNTFEQRK